MPRLDGPFNDTFKVCHAASGDDDKFRLDAAKQDDSQPLLLITPTYERAEQTAELTRLVQTLNHVRGDFQWIVVEDATECSDRVRNLVRRKFAVDKGKGYTLLAAQMPTVFRKMSSRVPLPRDPIQ